MEMCKCGEVEKEHCPCEYFEQDEIDPWEEFDPEEVDWDTYDDDINEDGGVGD